MFEHYPFVNTALPFPDTALEPYIDAKTMQLHHDKHLQAYIDNLNKVLEPQKKLQSLSLEQLIMNAGKLPPSIGVPIARNAGGVYNHRFFFSCLSPYPETKPSRELSAAIARSFGSMEAFQQKFSATALSVFGSGYAWLVQNQQSSLSILTTANQETPLTSCLFPIFTIDVWEHAYYLKHYNKRADYIADWWHVLDWTAADLNYMSCRRVPNHYPMQRCTSDFSY